MSTRTRSALPLRILIVEDNEDARTTLRMLLSLGFGHTVYEAATGSAAVQLALQERPDVALVDVGLPDLDGHEVARRIRAALDRAAILLVALTGYGTAEDFERTREAGFDVHLVKPVEGSELEKLFAARSRERAQANVSATS
jgi:CheY-like chemotaxis protein